MAIQYTPDQEKVIYTTGKSLLVSAAAGSGKTAVLVRRIIEMVTREENPISLHELLIVTFTNAAAAEMRERIGEAITQAIEVENDDAILQHLIEQMTLLSSAPIMTLHAFCLQILKSYYHLIDLDPNFRVGNETELVLMKEEVLDDLLEEAYEKKSEAFVACVEAYAPGKNDESLRDMIYNVYRFSRSHPWPQRWLDKAKESVHIESVKEAYTSEVYQYLVHYYEDKQQTMMHSLQSIRQLMAMPEGPDKYEDTVQVLESHVEQLSWVIEEQRYDLLAQVTDLSDVPPLSRKSKGYDKDLAGAAKDMINTLKADIESFRDLMIHEESFVEDMQRMNGQITELIRLTESFGEAYSHAKEEKMLIDFSDIEHFALAILYDVTGKPTEIAANYEATFYEVLVDEYQDINDVQETLLKAITKKGDEHNMFMVGDLKQSIYRFRLANPNIFADKYQRYGRDDTKGMRIDLSKNFRSRRHILDFTNLIFESVMSLEVGDVDYNDDVKLYYGASYDEDRNSMEDITEIMILEDPKNGDSKATLQAEAIATKIKELILDTSYSVEDKKEGKRRINYSDICILSRSPSGSMDALMTAFDSFGIPYESDTSRGYFDAIEVQVVIALLKVIDNPYQDIPLVALMRSPFVGFDEQDLLHLRHNKEHTLYENMLECLASEDGLQDAEIEMAKDRVDDTLRQRVIDFIEWVRQLRELAHRVPLHELLDEIYLQTGYIYMVPFMENGQQRYDNLRHLRNQSLQFEKTSYRGLFNFIRYIDHVKKYDIATPQPYHSQGEQQSVKIMSIHKSKGLEFPVVFLMDIHKQFNKQDLRQSVLLHPDMGVGSPYIDPEKRTKRPSIFSKAIQLQSEKELLSEELRLLYVALTRSREKLYMVGTVNDYEKKIVESPLRQLEAVGPVEVMKANSYLDILLMSCPSQEHPLYHMYPVQMEEESEKALFAELNKDEQQEGLIDLLEQEVQEDEIETIQFPTYTYDEAVSQYITMSVSELKQLQHSDVFESDGSYAMDMETKDIQKERQKPLPDFLDEKKTEAKGAYYGRMIHTILQLLPMKSEWEDQELEAFVEQLCDRHILPIEQKGIIDLKPVKHFVDSSIYERMVFAYENGTLYREKPFVLQWNVDKEGDYRMIQGIIDAYFIENGKGVLVDFKTDKVSTPKVLIERYRSQLSYYKKALEDIGRIEVSEVYIYSLAIQKAIPL